MRIFTDTERLDWIERNQATVNHRVVRGTQYVRGYAEDAEAEWWEVRSRMEGARVHCADTLRQAVDYAMNNDPELDL